MRSSVFAWRSTMSRRPHCATVARPRRARSRRRPRTRRAAGPRRSPPQAEGATTLLRRQDLRAADRLAVIGEAPLHDRDDRSGGMIVGRNLVHDLVPRVVYRATDTIDLGEPEEGEQAAHTVA